MPARVTDLTSLGRGGGAGKDPGHTQQRSLTARGQIAIAPKAVSDDMVVILTTVSKRNPYIVPAGNWEPQGGALPSLGAECLVVFDDSGDVFVPVWGGAAMYERVILPSGDATGARDDALIEEILAGLPNGGILTLGPGTWYSQAGWAANSKHALWIRGSMGLSAGATPATVVHFLNGGVNYQSTMGCRLSRMMLLGTDVNLVDLSHDASADDAQLWMVDDLYLGLSSVSQGSLVFTDKADTGVIWHVNLVGGLYAVQGVAENGSYSNGVTIGGRSRFQGQGAAQIQAPGAAWEMVGNVHEPLSNGTCAAIAQAFGAGQGGVVKANWFGDVTSGSGTQVEVGSGYEVGGNYVGGTAAKTTTGISAPAGVQAVEILPNVINSHSVGVSISSTASDVRLAPQKYIACTTNHTQPSVSVGAAAGSGGNASVVGTLEGGQINVTTGSSGTGAGVIATVTVPGSRSNMRPVIGPYLSGSGDLKAYVSAVSSTTFTITVEGTPAPSSSYSWFYVLAPSI